MYYCHPKSGGGRTTPNRVRRPKAKLTTQDKIEKTLAEIKRIEEEIAYHLEPGKNPAFAQWREMEIKSLRAKLAAVQNILQKSRGEDHDDQPNS